MNQVSDWQATVTSSFQDLWVQLIQFLPNLIGALLLLGVGLFLGVVVGRLVARIIRAMHVDTALKNAGLDTIVERTGYRLDAAALVGAIAKWFVFAIFLVAAVEVLGLQQLNLFLNDVVLRFLPNVFVAVLILLLAAVIADVVKGVVEGAARATQPEHANFLSMLAVWAIWIFALLAAVYQLGVAQVFLQTLFTGFIAAVALAVGLAFGLGGREAAARAVERLESKLSRTRPVAR